MKKIVILSALLSLSISPVNSGFAYAPMTTGEGATYAIYSITGVWHDTGYIE